MSSTLLPTRLRPRAVRRRAVAAYQQRSAVSRDRRGHDRAIVTDPNFALEHGLQVADSIATGRGGCPYCAR
jgi:hypothetical protein